MRRRPAVAALLCERRQAPAGDRRSDERDTPASGASKSNAPASGASKSNAVSRRATTASASRGAARAENYLRSHWLRPEKSLVREAFLSWPGIKVDPVQTGSGHRPRHWAGGGHGGARLLAAGGLPPPGRGGGGAPGLGTADSAQLGGSARSVRRRKDTDGRWPLRAATIRRCSCSCRPRMETGQFRVLTGLRQADGSVVAVVRGVVSEPNAPPPPSGPVQQVGVLLPTEEHLPETRSAERPDCIRALARPGAAVAGSADRWVRQSVECRRGEPGAGTGSRCSYPRDLGGCAMGRTSVQWWLFAAFTLFMAFRMARDIGVREAEVVEITPERPVEPT